MLLLVLVAASTVAYASLPLFIPTEDDLVLSLHRLQPEPIIDQSGYSHNMPPYFIWRLQNRGPFPIIISKAVWSVPGYPFLTEPLYPNIPELQTEPPRTDITLMPGSEYSYTFHIVENQCPSLDCSIWAVTSSGPLFAISPSGPVSVSLTAKLQILLVSRTAKLQATESFG